MVVYTCNPSTQELEDQEFKVILNLIASFSQPELLETVSKKYFGFHNLLNDYDEIENIVPRKYAYHKHVSSKK